MKDEAGLDERARELLASAIEHYACASNDPDRAARVRGGETAVPLYFPEVLAAIKAALSGQQPADVAPPVPDRQGVDARELLATVARERGYTRLAMFVEGGSGLDMPSDIALAAIRRALTRRPGYEDGVRAAALIEAAFRKGHEEGSRAADTTSRSQASHVEDAWIAYGSALLPAPLTEDQSNEG